MYTFPPISHLLYYMAGGWRVDMTVMNQESPLAEDAGHEKVHATWKCPLK